MSQRVIHAIIITVGLIGILLSNGCATADPDREEIRREARFIFGTAIEVAEEVKAEVREESPNDQGELEDIQEVIDGLEDVHQLLEEKIPSGEFARAVVALNAAYQVAEPHIPEDMDLEARLIKVAVERAIDRLEQHLENG